jgi:hypothetical protein
MTVADAGDSDGSLFGDVETDMIVECEDGELAVNSYIFCAASPVARRMLKTNMMERQTMRVKSAFTCSDFNSFYRFVHPATARWEELTPMNVGPVFRLSDFWQVDRLYSDCKQYLLGVQFEDQVTCRSSSQASHQRFTVITYVKAALDIADEYQSETDMFRTDLRNKATVVLHMFDVTLETVMLIRRYALEYSTHPSGCNALYKDALHKLARNVVALREIDADALIKEDSDTFVDLFKAVQRRQELERTAELGLDDNSEFESEQIANFMHYQFPR